MLGIAVGIPPYGLVLSGREMLMTSPKEEPTETKTSEEQQDEEAEARFADESPAADPQFEAIEESDPDESPEQPDDEA